MHTTLRTALIAATAAGIALTGGVLMTSGSRGAGPVGVAAASTTRTPSTPADGSGAASDRPGADEPSGEGAPPAATDPEGAAGAPAAEPTPDGPTSPEPEPQPQPEPEPQPQPEPEPQPQPQPEPGAPEPAGAPGVEVPGQLYVGAATSKPLPLASTGDAPLEWSVASEHPWLTVTSATAGVLAPGESVALTVHVDRRLTPQGVPLGQTWIGRLHVTTNAGVEIVVVRAIPTVTKVDRVCITRTVLGAPLHQVSYRATIELSANDALTVAVEGPNPKAATVVPVVQGSAETAVLLPGGARAVSTLVLRPVHGPEVVVPLQEGCTPSVASGGSLAEAGARL